MDEQPDTDLARDLTLIAKTIQNIANFIEFKEPSMAPVNAFVISNFDSMKQFLDNICTPLEKPVDSPPPNYILNFGREMSRVHYHIQTLLEPFKEKFGESDDLNNLINQIERINEETKRIITEENLDVNVQQNNTNNQNLKIEIPNNNLGGNFTTNSNNLTFKIEGQGTSSPNKNITGLLKGNQTPPNNQNNS